MILKWKLWNMIPAYRIVNPVITRVRGTVPVTPLLSGVIVHRVFCAYFVRFEGAGVMRRFPWCTQENI